MSKPVQRPALEDVLDTYVAAVEEPDLDTAREWGRRFPEYAEAIQDFAASWKLAACLPVDTSSLSAATFSEQGRAAVEAVLRGEQEKDLAAESGAPIDSLLTEAKARGVTPGDLAAQAGLSVPLVAKLNRRLIEPASIPRQLTACLATSLGRAADTIAWYLAQPPTLAIGGHHRAEGKPAIVGREDFFEAVRADQSLTDEQRARWLALLDDRESSP